MAKLQKAVITKKIIRPYGGVAEPQVGMTGHIVEESDTPENHTCIRFLSETLGYSYDPEYDDADRKYVIIYVPNKNFEIVSPKNTQSVSKESTQAESNNMGQPEIMMNSNGQWTVLLGHDCCNLAQMQEYVSSLDPTGSVLKVVDLAKLENNSTKEQNTQSVSKQKVESDEKNEEKTNEKMKQPEVMMNIAGGWAVFPGHDCVNQQQMEEYVKLLDSTGNMLKVMDAAELTATNAKKKKM